MIWSVFFQSFSRAVYYGDSPFENVVLGSRPSFGWRIILFVKELLDEGLSQMIENGQ